MTNRALKKRTQPQQPTLWLDSRNAWRQSEDAVIIPISYRNPETDRTENHVETIIIPISWPLTTPAVSAGQANDPDDLEGLIAEKNSQPMFQSFFITAPERSFIGRTRHLSIAVPMLLLGVIALVVFAWMTFR